MSEEVSATIDPLVEEINETRPLACPHVDDAEAHFGDLIGPSGLVIRCCLQCFNGFALAVTLDFLKKCRGRSDRARSR